MKHHFRLFPSSFLHHQGLNGQTDLCWEVAGDLRDPVSDEDFSRGLTWDVRLALALLEATCDPQIGGKFWNVYGRLLPQPHTVTVREETRGTYGISTMRTATAI